MNPCRCGHAYEPGYSCKRGRIDRCTADYQGRISGPLMDRIDLRIEVPAVTASNLILPHRRKVRPRLPRASRLHALFRARATLRWVCHTFAPTRKRRHRYWKTSRVPMHRDRNCFAMLPKPCACPRAAIIACCAWHEPLPISMAQMPSAASSRRGAVIPRTRGRSAPRGVVDFPANTICGQHRLVSKYVGGSALCA